VVRGGDYIDRYLPLSAIVLNGSLVGFSEGRKPARAVSGGLY
jgi:hypothetical protein